MNRGYAYYEKHVNHLKEDYKFNGHRKTITIVIIIMSLIRKTIDVILLDELNENNFYTISLRFPDEIQILTSLFTVGSPDCNWQPDGNKS